MAGFQLNERIAADTYEVADTDDYYLGLHKNALVAWLILVPKTHEVELFACDADFKNRIREAMDGLATFVQSYFEADKMNLATIGNVVSQLHIHIIARKRDDFAFPDPVWGKADFLAYDDKQKDVIIIDLKNYLKIK